MNASAEGKKVCSCCGGTLEQQKTSYAMGSSLLTNRFHVDIYVCSQCGHVELFAAKPEMETCPKCGTAHPVGEKCAICALDTVMDGKYGR